MADLWRDFWIRDTGTGQRVAQLHDRYMMMMMMMNRLPRVMKYYTLTGRRNRGRPLKKLLDTWDRNRSTSGPTAWQIYDDDDDDDLLQSLWLKFFPIFTTRFWNYELNILGAVADNKGPRLISTIVKIVCLTAWQMPSLWRALCVCDSSGQLYN